MSDPLQLKYRPSKLNEVCGNSSVVVALESFLKKESRPHSLLFQGPPGCGKTTFARILRKELKCHSTDYHEYNASNSRGIDTIREISNTCKLASLRKGTKVYLLDEGHMLTKEAQNALLKILEDYPKHVYFILATTNPEKLLPAIRSRCTTFEVKTLSLKETAKLLRTVAKEEGKSIPIPVIRKINELAEGHPREALKLLDTIIDIEDEEDQLEVLVTTKTNVSSIKELCQLLLNGGKWKDISEVVKEVEVGEVENWRKAILGYMSAVLINNGEPRASDIIEFFSKDFFSSGKAGFVQAVFDIVRED